MKKLGNDPFAKKDYLYQQDMKKLPRKLLVELSTLLAIDRLDLIDRIQKLIAENKQFGEHLREEFFIPEYLGFEEIVDDSTGDTIRIYARDGFSLSRVDNKYWIIIKPDKTSVKFMINNMLHGINVLSALGVPVSVETVTQGTDTLDQIDEIIDNAVEQKEQGHEYTGKRDAHERGGGEVDEDGPGSSEA